MFCQTCNEEHDLNTWHNLGMLCARCEQHTGNNHQGHYWKFCKVLARKSGGDYRKSLATDFHFCCPGDCELGEDRNA